MTRGKPHSDETRGAVLAALLAGQSLHEVARTYQLNRATVVAWRESAGIKSSPVEPQKRIEWGELISDALRSYLTTVSILAQRSQDETWFARQSAESIAVLIGVLTDKAVRILEAAEPADDSSAAGLDASSGAS